MIYPLPLLIIAILGLIGLLAVWLATSKLALWLRLTISCCVLAPLLLIPAYEPLLFFSLQIIVVLSGVWLYRFSQTERSTWTAGLVFSLRRALALMAVTAAMLTVFAQSQSYPRFWLSLVVAAFACGFVTLLAFYVALADKGRARRLATALIAIPIVVLPTIYSDEFMVQIGSSRHWWVILSVLFTLQLVWLGLWRALKAGKGRPSTFKQLAFVSESFFILAGSAYVFLHLLLAFPTTRPPFRVTGPNGYPLLMAAVDKFVLHPAVDDPDPDTTEAHYQACFGENAEALRLLRSGLALPCEQQLVYSPNLVADRSLAKKMLGLANVMKARAKRSVEAGDVPTAIDQYLEIVEFGHGTERGGLFYAVAVASIVNEVGYVGLSELRDACSAECDDRIIGVLSQLEHDRDLWQSFVQRDAFAAEVSIAIPWLTKLMRLNSDSLTLDGLHLQRNLQIAKARLLILDAAIRRYRRSVGRLPPSLQELDVADSILVDPLSKHNLPFRYRSESDDYFLASSSTDSPLVMEKW